MTRQIVLRAPPSISDRCQPLLTTAAQANPPRRKHRVAEVAGGTAAECAAVCCCCPCGLVDLLVLAVYKVPTGLCRKALRRKRRLRLMKKKNGLPPAGTDSSAGDVKGGEETVKTCSVTGPDDHHMILELEKEMFDNFYSGGFWRSVSQRSE